MIRSFAFIVVLVVMSDAAISQQPSGDPVKPISRILFGSCIQQDRPTSIFHTMIAERADLLLLTGDNIYADTADVAEMRRKYAQLAANPLFAKLRQTSPILATWDDHDFGVNDGGADFPSRSGAQQAFLDFFDVPADSPRRKQAGIYHAKTFGPEGKRIQVILLDTRYFRSPLKTGERRVGGPYYPDADSSKTMLGDAQWKWLAEKLKVPAEVRLVVSSIQFLAESAGQECWNNLPLESTRMLSLLKTTNANGVVFLSGDRHWSELSRIDSEVGYPLYDITCSSFNQIHPRGTPTDNKFRDVETTYHRENYGSLVVDWDASDPTLHFRIRDMEGTTRIEKVLRLSQLRR